MNNPIYEVVAVPSITIYIRKDNYVKLVAECQRLGMGESEFINRVLEVYFSAPKEKAIPAGP